MIAKFLPVLLTAAGISAVNGRAIASPQGVTDLLTPSTAVPGNCVLSSPNTYGLSIAPADSMPPPPPPPPQYEHGLFGESMKIMR